MRLVKIIAFGLVGLALGLIVRRSISLGLFSSWRQLPSPPLSIAEFVSVGDGDIIARMTDDSIFRCSNWRHECWFQDETGEYNFDSTKITQPCDLSSFEFSSFLHHPANISECIQGVSQYAEGIGRNTFVLDSDGNVWEWSYALVGDKSLYVTFAPFCFPAVGIVIGIIFFHKKHEDAIA